MLSRSYKKSIIREILSSKARFASILVIIFLGVAFFAGIKSSGPDIKESINSFYHSQNLMDSKIVSSLGLTEKDLNIIKNDNKVLDYYSSHSIDANLTSVNSVVKFIEYDAKNSDINKFVVIDGRLPKNSGEIAIDEKALKYDKTLKIGDTYKVESDKDTMESFKKTTFKIVGFVKSPMYIEKESRGTTNVGKGSIDYFAVLNKLDISMDVYTELYVRFKDVQGLDAYSNEYNNKMEKNIKYLENLFANREVERVKEIKSEAQEEFDKAYKEIEDGEAELLKGQKEVDKGREQIEIGKKEYKKALNKYKQKIKDSETELLVGQDQLYSGQRELDKQKQQYKDGEKKLIQAKAELDSVKKEFLNQGIDPDKSTSKYKSQINDLKAISDTYNSLLKDLKNTISGIKEGGKIPSEKINNWKSIITQPSLGFSDLTGLINNLENNPGNITIALNIVKGIESVSKTVIENISKLENLLDGITKYQQGKSQYDDQLKEFSNGKLQLDKAQKQIDEAKLQIKIGRKELEKGKKQGKEELDKAKDKLSNSEKQLIKAQEEIDINRQKLIEGREEIEEKKEELNNLDKSKYFFFDRNDNNGYSGIKDAVKSLDSIASVFPIFFFLVAVLICLTTMTRMVEENRVEIGTLKALGYSDFEISNKFIIYASLASISGSILGILVGCNVLPHIINSAYSTSFSLPELIIHYYPSYIIQSILASILCTVGAALFVLKVELNNNPSSIMRAKAPKLGKKILLERITPLWKRLNFNQKVTLRNLFRYKQRMIMTILGISGCMAMLVTGFALNNSNTEIINKQFNKLWNYQAMVVFNDDFDMEDDKQYNEVLKQIKGYDSSINIHQETITFSKKGMNKQTVTMFVPENKQSFGKYMHLNDRKSNIKYTLSDKGVIINEKLAKLLGVSVGDSITMADEDNNLYKVKVDNISENYIGHSIYMSPSYYEKVFKDIIVYNAQLMKLDSDTVMEKDDKISTKLMDCDKVINVTLTSKIVSTSEESTANLGLVMLVIIVSSGSLAFVVLYNLNNINVSERIRELSTIKVLGFFDNEVTMYILRENIILTLLGVITGSFFGKILYLFIINTAENDTMMMLPEVYMSSYIFAGLITVIFSLLVMVMMHFKLKNVNMIEALNYNE